MLYPLPKNADFGNTHKKQDLSRTVYRYSISSAKGHGLCLRKALSFQVVQTNASMNDCSRKVAMQCGRKDKVENVVQERSCQDTAVVDLLKLLVIQ